MPLIHDSAIVLTRLDYSETSLVLVVFTRAFGKVRVIAKGARRSTRKRFSPGIDLLEAGALVLSVRIPGQETLATLTEWKQTCGFPGLRERLARVQAAQYAADVTARLTEEWDPHPDLYDALYTVLDTLADADNVLRPLVVFQRTLLDQTGLLPRLDVCIACGRAPDASPEMHFSSHEGGLLCRDCEPAYVEKRQVRAPRAVLLGDRAGTDAEAAGAFDLFNYHISHLIGREPAAARSLAAIRPSHYGRSSD